MASVQEYIGQIKRGFDKGVGEWGIPAIIILVGFASFGLGRLSATESARPPVSVERAVASAESRSMHIGGLVVASRSGSAYHFPWCSGAQSIKEANKIWFTDEAAARKAGYTPAKNCKGLGTASSE